MSLIRRKPKPKKLSLRQIHRLYLLLKPVLPEKEEAYLIDEAEKLLEKMNDEMFLSAIEIMYQKKIEGNPVELLSYFIRGIRQNNFFNYVEFVQGLKHG